MNALGRRLLGLVGMLVCLTLRASSQTPSKGDRPFHLLKNSGDFEEGRKQYSSALVSSKIPRFGDCWKSALERLHVDCDGLTDESNARLALLFTNCFLDRAGKKTYPCDQSTGAISSCTESMDSLAFHAYTTFFTHTINMCFFLKSQVWHDEVEGTIGRLLDTSSRVQSQMSEHMQLQRQSLANERRLLDRGHELNNAIESSKAGVKQILVQFQESTSEQRLFIAQLFDRVVKFHSLVIGEFAGVYSIVFFVVSVALTYLLTSAKQTAAARFWIFCIIGLNLAVEKLAIQWRLEENVLKNSEEAQNIIYNRVWIVRKFSSYLALTTLVMFAWRYKDINVVNNELLKMITKQNSDISSRLDSLDTAIGRQNMDQVTAGRQRDTDTQSSSEEPLATSSTSGEDLGLLFAKNVTGKRTPVAKVSTMANVLSAITNSVTGTPKNEKKSKCRNSSINDSPQVSPRESPYNLRSRRSVETVNPIVQVEPPEMFAATIARLAKASAKNSLNMRKVLKERRTVRCARFSSDEDDGY